VTADFVTPLTGEYFEREDFETASRNGNGNGRTGSGSPFSPPPAQTPTTTHTAVEEGRAFEGSGEWDFVLSVFLHVR
jgi:hypothetical protein